MNAKKATIALLVAAALGAGGYGLYKLGMNRGTAMSSAPQAASSVQAEGVDPANERKVLYWHDPMVPGQKFDKPGKSPFMDMELVPVYADETGDEGAVSISPRVEQNLGVRTAEVTKAKLASNVEAVGNVAYNERDVAVVQARSNGYVERLFVRAPLDPVKKGQPLAALYVPDWVAAQEEYLTVKQMKGPGTDGLVEGARQRMRLAGMTDAQIRSVESSGKVKPRLTISSPINGVVGELTVREGMTIASGAPMFRINGLSTVWVNAEVPEAASAGVRPGARVEARTPALPGTVLQGKVSAILPEVEAATRTVKARVELANPGQRLVPGMFATVNFTPVASAETLTVPTEAVIQTGTRSVVMLEQGRGKFMPVEVQIGRESNGQTEVLKGLAAGQKVVVSGQFLIDSEASLRGTTNRLSGPEPAGEGKPSSGPTTHRAHGKVENIDKDEITFSHDPVPSMQWPAMTMGFRVPAGGLPKNLAVGDTVDFEFEQTKDRSFQVTGIVPAAVGATRK
ncbi:efflux RND transporter periplasmic adaptor subunit [Massilia suwonensis]|uniref:Efflux RND transporter periplasmic adaptor subunit n=1 Tax=Massilia suwonensis TaxID=648895 RepID=A0ABW0MJG3_9BURK